MNKACLVLIALMIQAPLFAGVTMVTQTTVPPAKCNFRVGPCDTSIEPTIAYIQPNDGNAVPAPDKTCPGQGDPGLYRGHYNFIDYASPQHVPTIDELVAFIRSKLSNCPEVTVQYDNETGDITLHYLNANGDCDCDWVVNVRSIKADDFVWKRTTDNYSNRLGQMERRKFHCTTQRDAEDIQSACAQIRTINLWTATP